MSSRDRKLLMILAPIILIVAYWFLLLSPKREEAASAKKDMATQQERLTSARAIASQADGAKTNFAADYGEIVRLGKAIPTRVDMPSLLVQLDRAADGTDITFTKITQGERVAAPVAAVAAVTPPAADGSTPPPATGTTPPPVAAGGAPAASAPGTATESANNAAATSSQANAAAQQSGVDPTTSTSSGGGLPVGGGATAPDGTAPVTSGGLETVPLELEFVGNFFRLADFFHDIKRFVHVANNNVVVNGRLVTIDGVSFSSEPTIFPRIKAELKATVYLSPLTQGVTAGATPTGPGATTTPAAAPATTPPAAGGPTPPATPAPTATATP
jgi:Tfp pilus assembly protein PilO